MSNLQLNEIIRELKEDLQATKKKAKQLNVTDEMQLYYSGIVIGLQRSIGKYEQWLNNTQPKERSKDKAKKKR